MTANETQPVCPTHCRDPDAWKAQIVGGVCGVFALALVVGAVIWIVRFHARQARLKDPQMVLTEEYLQQKKEYLQQEKKSPWWRFWAKKASKGAPTPKNDTTTKKPAAHNNTTEVTKTKSQCGESSQTYEAKKEEDEKTPTPPRLAILRDGPVADPSIPEAQPHVQTPASRAQVEFIAPYGLHLPHPPDVDPDLLSTIKSALKGKDIS